MLNIFKIGHYTDLQNGTGCTVIIPPAENVSAAVAMGASPGSREYALMQPDKKIQSISALLLTGGSAYGLAAATGVVDALEAQGIGYKTGFGIVPIVPAAVIFDLNIGNGKIRPGHREGEAAVKAACYNNIENGNVGAGTGALVGKWAGMDSAMKGGLGIGQVEHGVLKTSAVAVVNAVGDIINKNGEILSGAVKDGQFLASSDPKKRWGAPAVGLAENTMLIAVLTNARINKQNAAYLAQRGHLGITRRTDPSHTSFDGDTAFVISSNEVEAPLDTISAVVIEAVENAIIDAVVSADPLFNFPSVKSI
ncbi:MAG: P1 family peptidase [Calditrichaeota bacterium]|nr:P1 family peptidase [Calditrichota bacterium]